MKFIEDKDVWFNCKDEDLWIYDKVILAKKLGYSCAPAGIPVPKDGWYIMRPITNLRMMSRGAKKVWLTPDDSDLVPDGYFWCEWFEGRHISIDLHWGQQYLAVEGFKETGSLSKFTKWVKLDEHFPLPSLVREVSHRYKWLNVEMIGDKVIELHLRYNDDFANHTGTVIYPVWKDDPINQPLGTTWYPSPCEDRLGFWVK